MRQEKHDTKKTPSEKLFPQNIGKEQSEEHFKRDRETVNERIPQGLPQSRIGKHISEILKAHRRHIGKRITVGRKGVKAHNDAEQNRHQHEDSETDKR